MDYHDPEWVGAWWLGYLILGGVLAFVSLFMFTFPRRPPSEVDETKKETTTGEMIKTTKVIICPFGKGFLASVPLVLILCHALSSVPISALTTYGGKYLERQYRKCF